jgi:ketosteroid isomerase-like protein
MTDRERLLDELRPAGSTGRRRVETVSVIDTAYAGPADRPGDAMDDLVHFQALYEAFNRRDIDGVLAMMSEQVDWPNAWKGGRLVGREAVRDYWTAQWTDIDPRVEPISVSERADGSVAVSVKQVVRSSDGELLGEGEVVHVYRIRAGLIDRMDVEGPKQ